MLVGVRLRQGVGDLMGTRWKESGGETETRMAGDA